MSGVGVQTGHLTLRELRAVLRQPAYIATTLVQPMIWLLLFGQLFGNVTQLPGFGDGSYVTFMTPGVVIMTALFTSAWSGMGFIQDMERGVMNRFLVSPTRPSALLGAKLGYLVVTLTVQTLVVVGAGILTGARYSGGVLGMVVLLVSAILLAVAFGSFSNALALRMRTPESLIGIANFLVLPLSFLSSALMAAEAAPGWLRTVAAYNPVDWAVTASRMALGVTPAAETDPAVTLTGMLPGIGLRLGGLAIVALLLAGLAIRAFRSYQRSV
ncbi:MAG TPA: ABC transporter permease [Actinopolymorphaceae bacterium]